MPRNDNWQPSFANPREAALTLLQASDSWTWKAGRFLGQIAVTKHPLTAKQQAWLEDLVERAGFVATFEVSER